MGSGVRCVTSPGDPPDATGSRRRMHGAVFGTILAVILVIALLVLGAGPVALVPIVLLGMLFLLLPAWRAALGRSTFRRDTGAPSTRDASYDPFNRP
jgi:threonine/homoserine/homoserine lactone efflux protein